MTSLATRTSRYKRLAVMDRIGSSGSSGAAAGWRLLILRVEPSLSVEQATTFSESDASGLAAAIGRARADRIVRLIPLGQTMCRPVVGAAAPSGDPSQVASALELIAEAQMGSAAPAHRRSAGRLASGGLVAAAWSGNGVVLPSGKIAGLEETIWVPPVAALSALAGAAKADLGVVAERTTGAIAVVGSRADKSVARVTRDDGDNAEEWDAAVESAASSAGAALGLSEPQPGDVSGPQSVRLFSADSPRAVRVSVGGVPAGDTSWLDQYGLLLGAGIAAADGDPATAGLLRMTPEAFIPPQPVLTRAAESFATPAKAALVLAVCCVVLLGWPLLAAWIRYDRLSALSKSERVDATTETSARQQTEFYQLLRDRRWPMTKLLADLTTSLPAGVTLESVALEFGQKIRVSGSAESSQAVTDWLSALRATHIFDDLRTPTLDSSGTPVKFEIQARVAQPLTLGGKTIATPALPLAPAGTAAGSPGAAPAPATGAQRGPADDRNAPAGNGRNGRRTTPGSTPAPAKDKEKDAEAPAPLTDAEIAAMDRPTAMKEWTARRTFPQKHPTIDEATKTRLAEEADKCKARMQSLSDSGSGGGGS